jgi:hypothetical protein
MSQTFSTAPAELNLITVTGDEFACALDFSIDLTNYSWTAYVFESTRTVNNAFPAGIDVQGDTAQSFNVNVTDADEGELTISLTEIQTAALSTVTTYRWLLRGVAPGAVTRTYLSGTFTVRAP